jgi:hypothetical protein
MAACLWFRGWARARTGDAHGGRALIREGYALAIEVGTRARGSETLGYAAEALALAGDWPAAQREVEEAMQCAEALGERMYWPQLLLVDARIADALGERGRAEESIRRALADARAQQAPWLELIALSSLCEGDEATADEFESLRVLVDRLTEGVDTAPLARARALVEKARTR